MKKGYERIFKAVTWPSFLSASIFVPIKKDVTMALIIITAYNNYKT